MIGDFSGKKIGNTAEERRKKNVKETGLLLQSVSCSVSSVFDLGQLSAQ